MVKKRVEAGDVKSLEDVQRKYKSIVPEFEYNRTKGVIEERKNCRTIKERRDTVREVTYKYGTKRYYEEEIDKLKTKLDNKLAGEEGIEDWEVGLAYESLIEAQWGKDTLSVTTKYTKEEKRKRLIKVIIFLFLILLFWDYIVIVWEYIKSKVDYLWERKELIGIILVLSLMGGLGGFESLGGDSYYDGYLDGKNSKK